MPQFDSTKRNFLKTLAITPTITPVVLKEAAAKMKLSSFLGASTKDIRKKDSTINNIHDSSLYPYKSYTYEEEKCAKLIAEFFTDEVKQERLQDVKDNTRILDNDLANHISLSPTAAWTIQVQRNFKLREKTELSKLNKLLKHLRREVFENSSI